MRITCLTITTNTFNLCFRQVTNEEANAKATELNIMFMETSAKAGHNVKSLFKKIAMSLVGMEKEGEQAEAQNASTCNHDIFAFRADPSARNRCHNDAGERHSRCLTMQLLNHLSITSLLWRHFGERLWSAAAVACFTRAV